MAPRASQGGRSVFKTFFVTLSALSTLLSRVEAVSLASNGTVNSTLLTITSSLTSTTSTTSSSLSSTTISTTSSSTTLQISTNSSTTSATSTLLSTPSLASSGFSVTSNSSTTIFPSTLTSSTSTLVVASNTTNPGATIPASGTTTTTSPSSAGSSTTSSTLAGSNSTTSTLVGTGASQGSSTTSTLVGTGASQGSSTTSSTFHTSTVTGNGTVIGGVTQTLVTTTATDAAGSTYTGVITAAPSTTTTSANAGLITYSAFPSDISTSTTSAATNTHDSSGHPVLGKWPGCWFCPPGAAGIILFGFSGPGVYPAGGPPAGFPTPFPEITIGPDGDPTYESSPEPTQSSTASSSSSSESCTTTETATDITYFVSYVTASGGSVISSATYSTASTQVTGCTVTGTVATSTTATGSATLSWCQAGGCATCNAKRDVATATSVKARPTSIEYQSVIKTVLGLGGNATILERDIPYDTLPGEFYSEVKSNGNTIAVPLDTSGLTGISSSRYTAFDNAEHNLLVTGLTGCTSVMVVSRSGAWASHLWEAPSFRDQAPVLTDVFQPSVLDYLQNGRAGGEAGTEPLGQLAQTVFADTANTKIYIMTPAIRELDLEGGNTGSLTNGNNPAYYGSQGTAGGALVDRLTPLQNTLNGILPGVPISTFVYQRQNNPGSQGGGYGEAAILYSNKQQYDPNDPWECEDELPANTAVWQCRMQFQVMGSDQWTATANQQKRKRQAGACSLSSTGSSTGSITSTGSSTSSTDIGSIIISGLGGSNTSAISTPSSTTTTSSSTSTTTSAASVTPTPSANATTPITTSFSSATTAPPITSCTLSSVSAFTLDGTSYPASIECACNDDWTAGIATVSQADGSYGLQCEIGSTTIIVGTTTMSSTSTPPPSTTSTPPPSTTSTAPAAPTSASPNELILFSDSNCQDVIDSGDYDKWSSQCWMTNNDVEINSYMVGTTNDCGCGLSSHYCSWDTFVITTSSGCGYDDQVGGGCSGGKGDGSQTPTGCYKTDKGAKYVTAELATNGICKRDDGNGTMVATGGDEFDMLKRAAGMLERRC